MQPAAADSIFLLTPELADGAQAVEEIFRCEEIFSKNKNKTMDKESSEYLTGQQQRAQTLRTELTGAIRDGLFQGSCVFRGQLRALETLGTSLEESCRKELGTVASQVFDKYQQAAVQAETTLAEKFMNTDRMDRIESQKDPLRLVTKEGRINTSNPALVSILDHLRAAGSGGPRSPGQVQSSSVRVVEGYPSVPRSSPSDGRRDQAARQRRRHHCSRAGRSGEPANQ